MEKAEVDFLEAELRREFEANLAAIRRVQLLLDEKLLKAKTNPVHIKTETPLQHAQSRQVEHQGKTNNTDVLIDGALRALRNDPTGAWSANEILATMESQGFKFVAKKPQNSVITALARLVKRGDAVIVKKSAGRRPALFRATTNSLTQGGAGSEV